MGSLGSWVLQLLREVSEGPSARPPASRQLCEQASTMRLVAVRMLAENTSQSLDGEGRGLLSCLSQGLSLCRHISSAEVQQARCQTVPFAAHRYD